MVKLKVYIQRCKCCRAACPLSSGRRRQKRNSISAGIQFNQRNAGQSIQCWWNGILRLIKAIESQAAWQIMLEHKAVVEAFGQLLLLEYRAKAGATGKHDPDGAMEYEA
jgi:hypothetical protein